MFLEEVKEKKTGSFCLVTPLATKTESLLNRLANQISVGPKTEEASELTNPPPPPLLLPPPPPQRQQQQQQQQQQKSLS